MQLKHRALGEWTVFVWALHMHAILAFTLHRDPFTPKFTMCAAGCAFVRVLPNLCYNVRDAPSDTRKGHRTLPAHLGSSGIKKLYAAVAVVLFPAVTVLLLPTGHEILAVNLVAPFGLYAAYESLDKNLAKLADSPTFYHYTQAGTLLFTLVQFGMVLKDYF